MIKEKSLYETTKQLIFDILPKLKGKDLRKIIGSQWRALLLQNLPKKSKSLVMNLIKDIFKIEEPRLLVLKVHLYMEIIVNEILKKNLKQPEILDNYSFYQKVNILKAIGIFNNSLSDDLLYLNKLRNHFAHDLRYDVAELDLSQFSDMKTVYSLINYKRRAEKRSLNIFLIQFEIILLLFKMIEKFKVIHFLDVE